VGKVIQEERESVGSTPRCFKGPVNVSRSLNFKRPAFGLLSLPIPVEVGHDGKALVFTEAGSSLQKPRGILA
jgi:hypothetical protein